MQQASFDLEDPVFTWEGLEISVQLVTETNLYGLDPERIERSEREGALLLRAHGLRSAGGEQREEGGVELRIERREQGSSTGSDALRLSLEASAGEPIRCTKILLRDIETPLVVIDPAGGEHPIPERGELFEYPTRIPTPWLLVRAGTRRLGLRALDREVRAKRFVFAHEHFGRFAGRGVIELVHEEAASRFGTHTVMPPFEIVFDPDPAAFEAAHRAFLESEHGLRPFEQRLDMPAWAHDLALVVTLHGMHWSGRVLLDYAQMLEALRFVAARVDPRQVLAYIPGWEGRYYWQYGDYRPEPRLGGELGFGALCEGARELGIHLMPMFGAHCANARLPRVRELAQQAWMKSASGLHYQGNRPDWDLSRAHDPGWQAWLNPGHPGWRDELAGQIEALAGRFGFDAVFLDTTEVWSNDPEYPVFEGLCSLADRLRERIPDLLLAGEYDYDALLAVFPLFQRAWWTAAPAWTRHYVRRFGHLCEGEPEGRTGVHELGYWQPGAVAAEPGLLATLALQNHTLERSRSVLEAALASLSRPAEKNV